MTARGYRLTSTAAAASSGAPVPGEARPADRLDLLREHVQEALGLSVVDSVNLVNLARAYRDGDDRVALELLDRLEGTEGDLPDPDDPDDDSWEQRVADTTRRAQ